MIQPRQLPSPAAPAFVDTPLGGMVAPRLALMGVRFENGEGGAAPAPAPAPAPAAPAPGTEEGQAPAPQANATGQAAVAAGTAPSPADIAARSQQTVNPDGSPVKFEDLDPTTQGYVKKHREAAATAEQKLKDYQAGEQARIDAILVAAGVKKPEEQKTPEQIAADLEQQRNAATSAQSERDAFARETAISRIALQPNMLIDIGRLLDSKSFTENLSKVETTDTEALTKLLTDAAQKDPSLRITPVASGSGSTQHGGTVPTTGRPSLADAVGGAYKGR